MYRKMITTNHLSPKMGEIRYTINPAEADCQIERKLNVLVTSNFLTVS